MIRRFHYLKTNKRGELPRFFVFVDTESRTHTDDVGRVHHTLDFGFAECYRIKRNDILSSTCVATKVFRTYVEFWTWLFRLMRRNTRYYVFAHNWQFDAALLEVERLVSEFNCVTRKLIVDANRFIIDIKCANGTLSLRDTMNYFPVSLAMLGKSIGVEKLELPDEAADFAVRLRYCMNDVKIIRIAMLLFLEYLHKHNLGCFQPTLASQAFSAYRHRFMKHKILIHANKSALALERDAYFGGRVECFFLGEKHEKVYQLDVNSMYPYVMRYNLYPARLLDYVKPQTAQPFSYIPLNRCVVARVMLKTTEPVYPVRHKNKLVFPVGSFVTTLCTPELRRAIIHNHIRTVYEYAVYTAEPLFEDYVNYMYALRMEYRQAGNRAFEYMTKIMLNSLYGKFGQTRVGWQDSDDYADQELALTRWNMYDTENEIEYAMRNVLGVVQKKVNCGESENSAPAIAAHVTAYARMYLYELVQKAGIDNVYYVDTDSLIVSERGFSRLHNFVNSEELGRLKVECTADYLRVNGLKDYIIGDKVRIKGVSSKAVQLDDNTYKQAQFGKWTTQLYDNVHGEVIVHDVVKQLSRRYTKGYVHEDGRVTPLVLRADS